MIVEMALPGIVLLGAGGLGRETAEAIRAAGAAGRLLGFLDDSAALHGTTVGGLPVLGPTTMAAGLAGSAGVAAGLAGSAGVAAALAGSAGVAGAAALAGDGGPPALVVATVASSRDAGRRRRVTDRAGLADDRWATVVHPGAHLAASTAVGPGCVVLAGCVATADVTVGRHVVLMPGCVLTHDVVVGDHATLASGVRLSGAVVVGREAYLGTGAMVREGLRIGTGAVVGMGAVVTRDVPDGEVWAGVPARPLAAGAAHPVS